MFYSVFTCTFPFCPCLAFGVHFTLNLWGNKCIEYLCVGCGYWLWILQVNIWECIEEKVLTEILWLHWSTEIFSAWPTFQILSKCRSFTFFKCFSVWLRNFYNPIKKIFTIFRFTVFSYYGYRNQRIYSLSSRVQTENLFCEILKISKTQKTKHIAIEKRFDSHGIFSNKRHSSNFIVYFHLFSFTLI